MALPISGLLETAAGGLPLVREFGLNTLKASNLAGFLVDTSGNVTIPGTALITGVATFTAPPVFNGGRTPRTVITTALVGATVVLTPANSGSVYINAATSGSPSFTLPAAASGLEFTFITGSTTAGYTITGGVVHLKTSASGTALTSTTTVTNTQATAVVGDALSIVCDGTAWWMTSQSGIFAVS